jgi:hypothetical protein
VIGVYGIISPLFLFSNIPVKLFVLFVLGRAFFCAVAYHQDERPAFDDPEHMNWT